MVKNFIRKYGSMVGMNPYHFYGFIRKLPGFWRDYKELKKQAAFSEIDIPFGSFTPCLFDKDKRSGVSSGHYFHQDLLVASKIYRSKPRRHIDVGSRIDGFVAHVASFRNIDVADIRSSKSSSENINFVQLDIMDQLPENYTECTDSLSCLHVIEHFGLGRYGDPLRWDGHLLGFSNLKKMVKRGGILYISTPIGPQRIEFNAHRVFSVQTLLDLFSVDFEIVDFSYVDDSGKLHQGVELRKEEIGDNFGCRYGCGIFQLRKK